MASPLDLSDLFSRLDAQLATIEGQWGSRRWQAVRRGGRPDRQGYDSALRQVLCDPAALARLEAVYQRESAEPRLRRRAALWLSASRSYEAAERSGLPGFQAAAAGVLDSYRASAGAPALGAGALRQVLFRDPSRARRQAAYAGLARLGGLLSPLVRDALAGLGQAWARPGGDSGPPSSYWGHPWSPLALGWPGTDLLGIAGQFLEATSPWLERFAHLAQALLGVQRLGPWDWEYAQHLMGRPYDCLLPEADLRATLAQGLRSCGLDPGEQPLWPELAPKWMPLGCAGLPPTGWWAVPVIPPEDRPAPTAEMTVGLAVEGRLGPQMALANLAQAVGSGLGALRCRAGYLAGRQPGLAPTPPGALLALVAFEPPLLAGRAKAGAGDIDTYIVAGCRSAGLLRAMHLRQLAALAATAWQVMLRPGADPGAIGQEWLNRATGMAWDGAWAGLDLATLEDPGCWPAAFLSELAACQIAGFLTSEHGRLAGDKRTGECLMECFWRHGALVPLAGGVRLATGGALDPRAAVSWLAGQVGS